VQHLERRALFIRFNCATWCDVAGWCELVLNPLRRMLRPSLLVHSVHEFHISGQPDAKTGGWRNICPWTTQRLTYGQTSEQAYAAKHIWTSPMFDQPATLFDRPEPFGKLAGLAVAYQAATFPGMTSALHMRNRCAGVSYLHLPQAQEPAHGALTIWTSAIPASFDYARRPVPDASGERIPNRVGSLQ
jgi:hypothetical protein